MVMHMYDPSSWEAKAELLKVQDQPILLSKTLSQKSKTNQSQNKQTTTTKQVGEVAHLKTLSSILVPPKIKNKF